MNNFTHEMCWRDEAGKIRAAEYYYHEGKKTVYELEAPHRVRATEFNVRPIRIEGRPGWVIVPFNLIEANE